MRIFSNYVKSLILALVIISCQTDNNKSIVEKELISQLGDPKSYQLIDLDTLGILEIPDTTFNTREFLRLKYYYKNQYNAQVIGIHYFIIEDGSSILANTNQLMQIGDIIPLRIYMAYLSKIGIDENTNLRLSDFSKLSQEEINKLDIKNWK